MDAAAVADWLDQVAQEEVRAVSRVGGNMAMGGFKPMRAIPCRVLAIMGLHDAAFPRRARAPAWDLLAAAPRRGDRDPVREDRQLFLDALLAAGDRVIVTVDLLHPLVHLGRVFLRHGHTEPVPGCREVLQALALELGDLLVDEHLDRGDVPLQIEELWIRGREFEPLEQVRWEMARMLRLAPSGPGVQASEAERQGGRPTGDAGAE